MEAGDLHESALDMWVFLSMVGLQGYRRFLSRDCMGTVLRNLHRSQGLRLHGRERQSGRILHQA